MPDPADKKDLGGLARSIDSLFSGQSTTPEAAEVVDEPEADEPPAEGSVERIPADAVPELVPWDGFDDGPAAPPAKTDVEPEPESPPPAVPPPLPETETGPVGPPPLELAVESFLHGGGDGDRIRALAAGHAEALEFDPVAAAVERLVLGAGDPPDAETARLLEQVVTPIVLGRIVKRLGHERDEARRGEYHRICTALGLPMAEAIRDEMADASDRSARRAYFDALVAMGERARPVVEAMAEDENRFLARNGVAILGTLGGPRAAELVVAALANTDPRVRREALLQMARLEVDDAEPLILGLLEDTDQKVRLAAAFAAGELRVERAVRPLVAMLEDSGDQEVILAVLHALGRIGDPGAVPAIEKRATRDLFAKPPTDVRVAAYRALAQIGTPHARSLLEKAVEDKDVVIRRITKELVEAQ